MKKLSLIALLLVTFLSACSALKGPITTIEGAWHGTLTSTVYNETGRLTLNVGPLNNAGSHTSTLVGNGNNLTVYCEGDTTKMECYLYGLDMGVDMQGSISGRTWSGAFSFYSDIEGYDSGTFSFTK